MKHRVTPVLIGLLMVGIPGCGTMQPQESGGPEDHGIMHELHGSAQPIEIEEWNETLEAEAIHIARQAVTAYARPDLSETEWFAQLAPYLTENAKETYRQVSNLNIAATTVTTVHPPIQGSSPAIATVTVQTDAGALELLLSRSAKAWKVETITSVEPITTSS